MSSAANHRKRSHRSEGRTASAVGRMNAHKAIKPSAKPEPLPMGALSALLALSRLALSRRGRESRAAAPTVIGEPVE